MDNQFYLNRGRSNMFYISFILHPTSFMFHINLFNLWACYTNKPGLAPDHGLLQLLAIDPPHQYCKQGCYMLFSDISSSMRLNSWVMELSHQVLRSRWHRQVLWTIFDRVVDVFFNQVFKKLLRRWGPIKCWIRVTAQNLIGWKNHTRIQNLNPWYRRFPTFINFDFRRSCLAECN